MPELLRHASWCSAKRNGILPVRFHKTQASQGSLAIELRLYMIEPPHQKAPPSPLRLAGLREPVFANEIAYVTQDSSEAYNSPHDDFSDSSAAHRRAHERTRSPAWPGMQGVDVLRLVCARSTTHTTACWPDAMRDGQ